MQDLKNLSNQASSGSKHSPRDRQKAANGFKTVSNKLKSEVDPKS